MLSKIALIIRFILGLVDSIKTIMYRAKVAKREKLVEDIKSDDKSKQLDALDELRK